VAASDDFASEKWKYANSKSTRLLKGSNDVVVAASGAGGAKGGRSSPYSLQGIPETVRKFVSKTNKHYYTRLLPVRIGWR